VHISGNKTRVLGNTIIAISNSKTHIHKSVQKQKTKYEKAIAAPILEAPNAFLCISQSLFLFRVRVLF
jgi:hypothetical protein